MGRVRFLSDHFKKVALVELFDRVATTAEALKKRDDDRSIAQYYTGVQGIETGRWKIVGRSDVSGGDLEATRRIVGGNVYIGDDEQGPASADDEATLPQMDVKGVFLVEKLAQGATSPKPG